MGKPEAGAEGVFTNVLHTAWMQAESGPVIDISRECSFSIIVLGSFFACITYLWDTLFFMPTTCLCHSCADPRRKMLQHSSVMVPVQLNRWWGCFFPFYIQIFNCCASLSSWTHEQNTCPCSIRGAKVSAWWGFSKYSAAVLLDQPGPSKHSYYCSGMEMLQALRGIINSAAEHHPSVNCWVMRSKLWGSIGAWLQGWDSSKN